MLTKQDHWAQFHNSLILPKFNRTYFRQVLYQECWKQNI